VTESACAYAQVFHSLEFRDGTRENEIPGHRRTLIRSHSTYTPQRLRLFAESRSFSDFVFLAQGPLFGIASECMLKVTESACAYAQVFHSLEFRHGPKSIAGPETLITFLMSETSYDAEAELLEEMKALGAATMVIANRVDGRAQRASDFAIELGLQSPEYARPAAFAIWGQLYGVYYGLKKGLNPDSPKNLTRAVVLADGN